MEEIERSERAPWYGKHCEKPFACLRSRRSSIRPRAPAGCHTAWATATCPTGRPSIAPTLSKSRSSDSRLAFRRLILARSVLTPQKLEAGNANLVGGDIGGGAANLAQLFPAHAPALCDLRSIDLHSARRRLRRAAASTACAVITPRRPRSNTWRGVDGHALVPVYKRAGMQIIDISIPNSEKTLVYPGDPRVRIHWPSWTHAKGNPANVGAFEGGLAFRHARRCAMALHSRRQEDAPGFARDLRGSGRSARSHRLRGLHHRRRPGGDRRARGCEAGCSSKRETVSANYWYESWNPNFIYRENARNGAGRGALFWSDSIPDRRSDQWSPHSVAI